MIGRLEFRSLAQSLGDIAGRFRDRARFLACGDKAVQHIGRRQVGVRPFVPVMSSASRPCLGGPHVIADDRDEIVENDDLSDPRHGLRPLVVDMRDLAAEHRAARERGDLYARRPRVDAVNGFAVDLVGRVEPFQRLADQLEIRCGLERRILRRRQSGGRLHKLAVRRLLGARVVKRPRRSPSGRTTDRRSTSPPRPAPAWPARLRRRFASASRSRGRRSSRRSPGTREADSRKACRSGGAATAVTCSKGASSSSARIMERAV